MAPGSVPGLVKVLVTGSAGLIGSEAVEYFDRLGFDVHGVDNNMRADFFGPGRRHDVEPPAARGHLRSATPTTTPTSATAPPIDELVRRGGYELVIHAAAQPSHDLAASRPFDDFDVNANGTLNLLEAARRHTPDAVFITVSTNKVYGDNPNRLPLVELDTRWDYADPAMAEGIDETMSLDHCTHSRVRRLEGRRRRAHPGVRALLRPAHRHLPRRVPHRPAPLRRRAARLPQLPRAHRAARGAVHDLRLQGEAGPRPDPLRRRDQRVLGLRPGPPARRGVQPRRREGRTPPACSSASSSSPTRRAASAPCSPTTSRPGSATTSATTPTWRKFRAHFPGWRQEHDLRRDRRGDGGRGGVADR